MATPVSVWGIDIGQCALKALKLREVDGQLQAEAFDIIEYPQILSQPSDEGPHRRSSDPAQRLLRRRAHPPVSIVQLHQ